MLTEKQIENLSKLDPDTLIQIMHECAEVLGLVSVDEYCKILGVKRRTAYEHIKIGKIKSIIINNHIFAIINS